MTSSSGEKDPQVCSLHAEGQLVHFVRPVQLIKSQVSCSCSPFQPFYTENGCGMEMDPPHASNSFWVLCGKKQTSPDCRLHCYYSWHYHLCCCGKNVLDVLLSGAECHQVRACQWVYPPPPPLKLKLYSHYYSDDDFLLHSKSINHSKSVELLG